MQIEIKIKQLQTFCRNKFITKHISKTAIKLLAIQMQL